MRDLCQWRKSTNNDDVCKEHFEDRRDQANSASFARDEAMRLMINGKRKCDLSQRADPLFISASFHCIHCIISNELYYALDISRSQS